MVTCDTRDREFEYFKCYPCLIVEVISDTTEAFDRGRKFTDYRRLESLQEYLIISQNTINVECFRRNDQGRWELYPYSKGETVHLASIDFECAIAQIYEDVAVAD